MVQPIQYQVPGVADPFANVVQGLRLGATLQELDLARAAQQQKMLAQQAAMEQQRQANEAMSAYLAKPSGQRTLEDTRGLIRFLPAEQVKNLIDIDSRLSEDQRRNQVLFAGQVGSALRLGNTDVALQMVRQRMEAETDPQKKQGFQLLAQSIEKGPEAALETLRLSTVALGKDYEPAAKAMFGAPTQGFKVLTTPEAKARNLPTDRGQVWQLNAETGQVTALQAGEKPQAQLVTTNAKGLADRFGITGAEPGLYQIDTATNKITPVGRGGTNITVKSPVGPPPKDFRYNYDDQGNVVSMTVMPGSETERKLREAEAAKGVRAESTLLASTIVTEDLGRLRETIKNQTTFDPVTGRSGALMEAAGPVVSAGSARNTALRLIQTIKANIGFDRLNQMRSESPTGGALGNVTEKELEFLQNVLGSIDLNQKDEDILKNIDRLENIYTAIMRKAAAYPNAAKYGFAAGGAAPAAAPEPVSAAPAPAPAAPAPAPAAPAPTPVDITQLSDEELRRRLSRRFDEILRGNSGGR